MSWKMTVIVIAVAYMAVTTTVGVWSAKYTKSATQFMAARNAFGPLVVGFLMMSEFFGTGSFLGTPETSYSMGMFAAMSIISLSVGFFFYAFFIAPKYKDTGDFTVSGVLQSKYGQGARYSASLLMIFALLVDTVSNYTGGAVALGSVLGVNVKVAGFVLAAMVSAIVASGGLRGIGVSNMIHIVVKYAALITIAVEAWHLLHGSSAAQHRIPHRLYTVHGTGEVQLVTWTVGNVGAIFATQYVVQSVSSLRNRRQALGAGLIASGMLIPAGLLGAYIGVAARGLFPGIDSANAVPMLLHRLGPLTAGLVTAGIVAAAMVSLSALVIGATTLLVKDFYIPLAKPRSTENVTATRVTAVVLGLLPLPFVWYVPDLLHVVFFSRGLRAAIGVIVVFAFYLPSVGRSRSVMAGLVGSLVCTTVWYVLDDPFGIDNVYVAIAMPLLAMLTDAGATAVLRPRRRAPDPQVRAEDLSRSSGEAR